MKNQAIVRAFQYSLADFQKQDGRQICFFYFLLNFFSHPFSSCIIPTVLNLSREMTCYTMLIDKSDFGGSMPVCMCHIDWLH